MVLMPLPTHGCISAYDGFEWHVLDTVHFHSHINITQVTWDDDAYIDIVPALFVQFLVCELC